MLPTLLTALLIAAPPLLDNRSHDALLNENSPVDQIVVDFDDAIDEAKIAAFAARHPFLHNLRPNSVFSAATKVYIADVDPADVTSDMEILTMNGLAGNASAGIENIEPNYLYSIPQG